MKLFSLATISTKAAAAGVLGLAALGGTGTALVLQPANDTRSPSAAEVEETTTKKVEDETTTTDEDESTSTDTGALDTTANVTTDGEDHEDGEATAAKDNFGAVVSADARDGGVEGQEISAEAHARNEARKAQRSLPPVDDEEDEADEDEAEAEAEADDDEVEADDDEVEVEAEDVEDEDETEADDDHTPEARTHGKAEGRKG